MFCWLFFPLLKFNISLLFVSRMKPFLLISVRSGDFPCSNDFHVNKQEMIQNSCGADNRQKANCTKGTRQLGFSACSGGSSQHGRRAPLWLVLGAVTRKLLKALKLEGAADQIDKLVTGTYLCYPRDLAFMGYSWKSTQLIYSTQRSYSCSNLSDKTKRPLSQQPGKVLRPNHFKITTV